VTLTIEGNEMPEPAARRYLRKADIQDEALRYVPGLPGHDLAALKAWGVICGLSPSLRVWVEKSRAWCQLSPGDYVVREADGSGVYPCAEGAFWSTHEFPE